MGWVSTCGRPYKHTHTHTHIYTKHHGSGLCCVLVTLCFFGRKWTIRDPDPDRDRDHDRDRDRERSCLLMPTCTHKRNTTNVFVYVCVCVLLMPTNLSIPHVLHSVNSCNFEYLNKPSTTVTVNQNQALKYGSASFKFVISILLFKKDNWSYCDAWSVTRDPWSVIRDPWSVIRDPWSVTRDPWRVIQSQNAWYDLSLIRLQTFTFKHLQVQMYPSCTKHGKLTRLVLHSVLKQLAHCDTLICSLEHDIRAFFYRVLSETCIYMQWEHRASSTTLAFVCLWGGLVFHNQET